MRVTLKPGEFKFGISDLGVVVGIQPIINIGNRKYAGADITTQWSVYIDNQTGKMERIDLEIEWLQFAENIIIPFNVLRPHERMLVGKICRDHNLFFVDINETDEEGHGVGTGLFVEVSRIQALDWLNMEARGESVKNWKSNRFGDTEKG